MPRDRFATRALILECAATIVASDGVAALGVNSLAHAAQCDKVLIYRYFGGLDGVLAALGAERMMWPKVELGLSAEGEESLAGAVERLMLEEWAALSGSTLMLAAACAELSASSAPLGSAAELQRSGMHSKMVAELRAKYQVPAYVDLPALVELLSGALTVFALRTAYAGTGAAEAKGVSAPPSWRRIEKMISAMTRALLDTNDS